MGMGISDITFTPGNIGFSIDSAAMLCDCCYVRIEKTLDGGQTWSLSLDEETNASNCHANAGYAKIKFASENTGYALLGPNVLKTPLFTATVEDIKTENHFIIYPNPTTNGSFNLKINSMATENLSLEILDIMSKKIYVQNDLKENNIISIANNSEGIYFVKLLRNGKMIGSQPSTDNGKMRTKFNYFL